MSVDERLRAGLDANASGIVPGGEARLSAVRARHRRRLVAMGVAGVSAAAATAVLVLDTLTGGTDRAVPPEPAPPAETATTSPTTPPASVAGLIPNSTWRKVVTTEQARDEEVSSVRIRRDIGDDGRLPLELRLMDGNWTQTGDYGGAAWVIGDSGTVAYDERGRLVAASDQCATCSVLSITWRIDGSRLVITELSPRGGSMVRAVWLGTWRRAD